MKEEGMRETTFDAQALLDQLSGFAREFPPIVGNYYRSLRENGVPASVAGMLCSQMQTALLAKLGFFPDMQQPKD